MDLDPQVNPLEERKAPTEEFKTIQIGLKSPHKYETHYLKRRKLGQVTSNTRK